jgi:DNA-directed RNA polymerase specialized sigma24 family protein
MLRRAAARLGVDASERRGLAEDALADVLRAIVQPGAVAPRSLLAYSIGALRHAHLAAMRRERRHERIERALHVEQLVQPPITTPADAALTTPTPTSDDVEGGAADADVAPTGQARVLRLLTREIEARISAEEREILKWLADYVPQRDMARWLGTTYGAMRVRVHRLRERLRRLAVELAPSLAAEERRELDRFFRRTGVIPSTTPTRRASRGRSATDAETP